MGVKRELSLTQVRLLFPTYTFTTLTPSCNGIIDTTYISDKYVIKFYERNIQEKITTDAKILRRLHSLGLNVPRLLTATKGWYLYDKLPGNTPKLISYFHIQTLARFMARFHSQKLQCREDFLEKYSIKTLLQDIKHTHYRFYKELEVLLNYKTQNDGFIHGDLFCDNTVFTQTNIGVFDFIDGGNGSYAFDIAVALLSFNTSKRNSYTRVFLNTYNQKAPKKITLQVLLVHIKIASLFYAMLRLKMRKERNSVKKLIFC